MDDLSLATMTSPALGGTTEQKKERKSVSDDHADRETTGQNQERRLAPDRER
jgi:hypothetical protein